MAIPPESPLHPFNSSQGQLPWRPKSPGTKRAKNFKKFQPLNRDVQPTSQVGQQALNKPQSSSSTMSFKDLQKK